MDPHSIAKQFLDSYYETISSKRLELVNFYTNESCFSYEGDSYKGVNAIREKLESMVYSSVAYPLPDQIRV
jgi:hypothetical protein